MKDAKRIRVIIKNPYEPYGHEAMLLDRLATYQNVVDGPIETVPLTDKAVIVCDEDGKLNRKPFNFYKGQGQEDYICGTVIVVGVDGDEFTDCTISMETWKTFLTLWGN